MKTDTLVNPSESTTLTKYDINQTTIIFNMTEI